MAWTKSASDEGLLGDGVCGYPSPVSNRDAVRSTLSHKGRGKKETYPAGIAGTGSAVTDLIFSIANREVTFFSATAAISFL